MRYMVKLKKAKAVEVGEHVLKPQQPNGILIAKKITKAEVIDDGKRVEIQTDDGILHVLSVKDVLAVVV